MKDTSDFLEVMRGRILARGMRTDRLVEEGLKAEGLGVRGPPGDRTRSRRGRLAHRLTPFLSLATGASPQIVVG